MDTVDVLADSSTVVIFIVQVSCTFRGCQTTVIKEAD